MKGPIERLGRINYVSSFIRYSWCELQIHFRDWEQPNNLTTKENDMVKGHCKLDCRYLAVGTWL